MSLTAAPVALIDLGALGENYRLLCARARPAEVGTAVKANAYGLGLEPIARTLFQQGCRTFFTAHFGEALALRRALPRATIAVRHGLTPAEFADCDGCAYGSSVRGWGLTSWGRGPAAGARGRRAFMLPSMLCSPAPTTCPTCASATTSCRARRIPSA